jgi:hypothetical protein
MKDKGKLDRREFTVASVMALLSGVTITVSGCSGDEAGADPPPPRRRAAV